MDDTRQLADEIFADSVFRARAMSPEEKLAAGPELFEYACGTTLCGIRHQHPEAEETEVPRILTQRLALAERIEAAERKQSQQEPGRAS